MEHRKENEAVYFAHEDSHVVMSEKVSNEDTSQPVMRTTMAFEN
jgi:hypothetical protein